MWAIILCLLPFSCLGDLHGDVDPTKTKIFGPGLKADKIVMPARYFYIEAYDKNGIPFDSSPRESFQVSITGESDAGPCRVWTEVLDRQDGSFIVRYKLYNSCHNLKIQVSYKNELVAKSPYLISEPAHPEACYCPSLPLSDWMEQYECSNSYPQITRDLEPFPTVNFSEFRSKTIKRFDRPGSMSICNYVIKDNELYRKCYGQHVGFKMFWDNILLSLTRKTILPDVELLVNLGDWPLVHKDREFKDLKAPMISWCGSEDTADIVVPTYDITEASLECMGRVTLDMLSIQGRAIIPWHERIPKAFWRGRDSRRERLQLIDIARKNPDLYNASLTNFFFFKDEERIYGPKEPHVSFFEFFDYKYQVNLDGTVAAYRFPYLLAGGSLVLKQDSEYYEHFYKDLKPWVHYVPFARDVSDLTARIKWAIENDGKAHQIARTGQLFARENLTPQAIFCYHAALLQEWSKRLVSPVKVRKGMKLVEQPDASKSMTSCTCGKSSGKDEL